MKRMLTSRAIFKITPQKQPGKTKELGTGCHFCHYWPSSFRNLVVAALATAMTTIILLTCITFLFFFFYKIPVFIVIKKIWE